MQHEVAAVVREAADGMKPVRPNTTGHEQAAAPPAPLEPPPRQLDLEM